MGKHRENKGTKRSRSGKRTEEGVVEVIIIS
jgi:hypothetical protein